MSNDYTFIANNKLLVNVSDKCNADRAASLICRLVNDSTGRSKIAPNLHEFHLTMPKDRERAPIPYWFAVETKEAWHEIYTVEAQMDGDKCEGIIITKKDETLRLNQVKVVLYADLINTFIEYRKRVAGKHRAISDTILSTIYRLIEENTDLINLGMYTHLSFIHDNKGDVSALQLQWLYPYYDLDAIAAARLGIETDPDLNELFDIGTTPAGKPYSGLSTMRGWTFKLGIKNERNATTTSGND